MVRRGVADRRHRVRRGRPGRDLRVDQPRHRRLVHLRPRPPPELRAAARARSHDLARLGDLRARPARRRHGAGPDRAPLGEPRPPDDHDREGLPARPRRAPRSLPRGVAARARGLAHRGVARLSALRFPRRGGGADVTRLAVALGTLLALAAHAADPVEVDLRRLFPRQAEVYVPPTGGLSELRLPAEVLAACRPDLYDLRLFDRRGLEIPYVIDAGPEARTRAEVADRVEAQILEARREEIGRADAPALRREAYVVVAPTRTTEVGTWDLVMETDRPRFVRRVDVRAEAADGTGVQVLENASVFRLGAQRDKTRLPLPPLSGARLTVTVEGEEDFYLEPRLFFEGAHVLAARAEAAVDLAEVARQDADGRTVLELARPRGLVPDVLRLRTTTGNFDRPVEVWDEGPGVEPVLLGRADVFRVQALARAEEREVSLRAARGDRAPAIVDLLARQRRRRGACRDPGVRRWACVPPAIRPGPPSRPGRRARRGCPSRRRAKRAARRRRPEPDLRRGTGPRLRDARGCRGRHASLRPSAADHGRAVARRPLPPLAHGRGCRPRAPGSRRRARGRRGVAAVAVPARPGRRGALGEGVGRGSDSAAADLSLPIRAPGRTRASRSARARRRYALLRSRLSPGRDDGA